MSVEDILFDVAEALRIPVLVLAVIAVVVVLLEVGALLAELSRRRRRGIPRLERGLDMARAALAAGDKDGAVRAVRELGYNRAMSEALAAIVEQRGRPDAADRIAKRMAEYDYRSMRRLERTRILVRAGPALGLMGTLIPLSPALAALADGDVSELTSELRVAFSVTVAGLLIGMVAFAISMVRDRLYSQDYSDVEYVAASLAADAPSPNGKGGTPAAVATGAAPAGAGAAAAQQQPAPAAAPAQTAAQPPPAIPQPQQSPAAPASPGPGQPPQATPQPEPGQP